LAGSNSLSLSSISIHLLKQPCAKFFAYHLSVSAFTISFLQAFVQRAGYDYVRIDGSTPQKARQPLVDQFNGRPSIFLFLMSTVAGGVGINLAAANKVVSRVRTNLF
jgi:hypothetical protein